MIHLASRVWLPRVTAEEIDECLRDFRGELSSQEATRRHWAELAAEDRRDLVRARRMAMRMEAA